MVMQQIQRTEIDGVPVFWTEGARRHVGALLFRVGRCDEPFHHVGITHLVEHLVLHQVGERPFSVNGFVDHLQTVFFAIAEPDEIATFLADVVAALGSLQVERLTDEMRVLRAEAGARRGAAVHRLLSYRYGPEGPGRLDVPEWALHRVTPEEVLDWTRTWFTGGNAAVSLSMPPPASLRFRLPVGERRLPPSPCDVHPLPLPSCAAADVGGVVLGAPLPRITASTAGLRILRARAERRLRRELALSYEVSMSYLPLDNREGHGAIFASCEPVQAARVAGELMGLAEALARDGVTAEELADDLAGFRRNAADPDAVLTEIGNAAACELVGFPVATLEELDAELAAVTASQVQETMAAAVRRAVLLSRMLPPLHEPWRPYPMWSESVVTGVRYDSVEKRFPWTRGTPVAVASEQGVSVILSSGNAVTVRFDACAGIVRESPTVRHLYGVDGFHLRLDAAEWRRGDALVASVDRFWSPQRQVALHR